VSTRRLRSQVGPWNVHHVNNSIVAWNTRRLSHASPTMELRDAMADPTERRMLWWLEHSQVEGGDRQGVAVVKGATPRSYMDLHIVTIVLSLYANGRG